MALRDIQPRLELPPPREVRDGRPPLDAIELFARARGETHQNRHFAAVGYLERAILLDAESYELYFALGEAYLSANPGSSRAIEAFEKAAELRPGSIPVRLHLARLYAARDDYARALEHLRLARLSDRYGRDDADTAMVDLLLGRVLEHEGYDRAALQCYERALIAIKNPSPAIRQQPELAMLANAPQSLYLQIAQLASRRGDHHRAIASLRAAAELSPHDLDLQGRLLREYLAAGRTKEMRQAAMQLLRRFHGNEPVMKLLRELYAEVGPDALIDDLRAQQRSDREDPSILLALVGQLQDRGRTEEAERLLADAARRDPSNTDVVERLVVSLDRRGQTHEAARWLIESAARDPATMRATAGLWASLLQVSRRERIRLHDLQQLEVSPEAEAARFYWVSRLAELWNRHSLSRDALQRSVDQEIVFPPSYRMLLADIWRRPELDDAQKAQATQVLIDRVRAKGHETLAMELTGLLLLNQGQGEAALQHLAAAVKREDVTPELLLTYAEALMIQGQGRRAEQMLWKLVSDYPTFEEAYERLFNLYVARRSANQAIHVLQTWLTADPATINGRLIQAFVLMQGRQYDPAERLLLQLFEEAGDNEQVLGALQALYTQRNRTEQWIRLLEREWEQHPDNHQVVARLVSAYAQSDRQEDAARVLNTARQAAADEPDVLYFLAHLYGVIDQKEVTDEVLQQVIRLDPTHAAASNDLGYSWADAGRRLDEAEALIRVAVEAEPDNQAFLDSLGWVLYKRSNFEEARQYLERALGEAVRPDPVVVDHLGDTLYRLGRTAEAHAQWLRARELLGEGQLDRSDLRDLRIELQRKIREYDEGATVRVAPVVEPASQASQQAVRSDNQQ